MPVLISGILRDGAGKPVQGCTIHLKAKRTSPTVVVEIISSDITGPDGSYRIEAEPGYYSVSLLREGFPPSVAGEIYVTPTDAPDTLNAFLDAPKDADLRPEVMKRFEEMVNRVVDLSGATEKDRERAEQAAQSAGQSRDSAALSATAAAESQTQAERSAAAADVSARSADDNARQTAQDVLDSGANADDAAKSAQSSQNDASRAEQAAQASEHAAGDSARHAESAGQSAVYADQSRQDAVQSALSAHESERAAAAALDGSARNAVRAESAATEGERSATAAAQSEQAASASADNAATSEQNAATSAGESSQSAEESAESARLAGQHKDAAALSEQGAKDSEDACAEYVKEIAEASGGILKKENNLSEFADADSDAVAELHKNLQLGSAARQDVQSDIYDRAAGRLALPGALGYGAIYSVDKSFSAASGPAEFLEWVKKTPPGRYCVLQYGGGGGTYNAIIPGVNFQGILEINIGEVATPETQGTRSKLIEFRGVNGDFYKNRLNRTYFIGWENLRPDDVLKKLYGRLVGEWGDPDVNSLVFAVYHGGLTGGESVSLPRGKVVSGSSLGPLAISAPISATGVYSGSPLFLTTSCNTHPFPGSYVALSGTPTTKTTDGLAGLFMRIA